MLQIMKTEDFPKVYALMEMSLPADEYGTFEDQKKLLEDPKYTVYILPDEDRNIKAFITVHRLDGFAFIEHFAVDPGYRSQGIGTAVLEELRALLHCPMCLEVELPQTQTARRRIGFYERSGFHLNRYRYIQPAYSHGKQPVPLLVMTTGRPVSEEEFLHIKTVLYREVYRTNNI